MKNITNINLLSLTQQRDLLLEVVRRLARELNDADDVHEAKRIVQLFDSRDALTPNQRRLLDELHRGQKPSTSSNLSFDVHALSEKLSLTTSQIRGCMGSLASGGYIVKGQTALRLTEKGIKAYNPQHPTP